MMYKNNYQRKRDVWREKWMKKVEERQKQKALINFRKAAYEAGVSLQEAFVVLGNAISEVAISIGNCCNEIIDTLQKPEVIEELKRLQEKENE